MSTLYFVANWKMELSYQESFNLLDKNKEDLKNLQKIIHDKNYELIICPSFDALSLTAPLLKAFGPSITLGAQDCSHHERGPYTGQVAARSLAEIGASYCIVGHSERRAYQGETNQEVFGKATQLLNNNIIPIICIGETQEEKEAGKTQEVLEDQIAMCNYIYHQLCPRTPGENKGKVMPLCIAYEPVWAIGTGDIPHENKLTEALRWIRQKLGPQVPVLYGGSITERTIQKVAAIPQIDGFLIGKASCDIQNLKNMVQLV